MLGFTLVLKHTCQGNNLDDIGTIDAEAFSNSYGATGSPVTFTVTVASKTTAHPYNGDGSGNMYLLDGVAGAAPILGGFDATTADSEYFYKFDQSDSSNASHPLRFYLDAAKNNASYETSDENKDKGSRIRIPPLNLDNAIRLSLIHI